MEKRIRMDKLGYEDGSCDGFKLVLFQNIQVFAHNNKHFCLFEYLSDVAPFLLVSLLLLLYFLHGCMILE